MFFVHGSTKLGVLPDLPWWRLVFPFHGCDGNLAKQFGRGKKQIEMLRGRHRRSENGHIMWPVKKIITMLALLDATRDTIGIVMGLPRHSRITRHLKLPLTLDQICGIVQETLIA
jgi:hypothetical protein